MTWSRLQIIMVHKASKAAGWNDSQRYIAMKRAGCHNDRRSGRPSVKHQRNTNTNFELFMELAEACAKGEGKAFPKPREHGSWREVCLTKHYSGWFDKARQIGREAAERLPHCFDDGLIQYAITHTYADDDGDPPQGLTECTSDHLYRVIECLKSHVGRKFLEAGIVPHSFEIPPEAKRRAG